MIILEENFKWHLEAFASELFIYRIAMDVAEYLETSDRWVLGLTSQNEGFQLTSYGIIQYIIWHHWINT